MDMVGFSLVIARLKTSPDSPTTTTIQQKVSSSQYDGSACREHKGIWIGIRQKSLLRFSSSREYESIPYSVYSRTVIKCWTGLEPKFWPLFCWRSTISNKKTGTTFPSKPLSGSSSKSAPHHQSCKPPVVSNWLAIIIWYPNTNSSPLKMDGLEVGSDQFSFGKVLFLRGFC